MKRDAAVARLAGAVTVAECANEQDVVIAALSQKYRQSRSLDHALKVDCVQWRSH